MSYENLGCAVLSPLAVVVRSVVRGGGGGVGVREGEEGREGKEGDRKARGADERESKQ